MPTHPKYSIIIPTKDAFPYIESCIQSVITQDYEDYELIVSENHSQDETYNFVCSLNHPRIRLIKPDSQLAMADHFEWALAHATGEWILFLGADDGLMPYFFRLADHLTHHATLQNISAINSPRAYFFWDGTQNTYGACAINYFAQATFEIKNSKYELIRALLGDIDYINLPQMYSNSLIHRDLVNKAKQKQNGRFYTSLSPDSCGAAIITNLSDKFLDCCIPLGWVGTSPKSNGLQYSSGTIEAKKSTLATMCTESISWNRLMGTFDVAHGSRVIHNCKFYLFESILQTHRIHTLFWNKFYTTKIFKLAVFAKILQEMNRKNKNDIEKIAILKEILVTNGLNFRIITQFSFYITPLIDVWFRIITKIKKKLIIRKEVRKLTYYQERDDATDLTLIHACHIISAIDKKQNFIETYTKQ